MGKVSQIDRVVQNIDKEIADLQAMRQRLLLKANEAAPKRVRKPKPQTDVAITRNLTPAAGSVLGMPMGVNRG